MPTKYIRESRIDYDRELRKTPWMRQGALIRPLSRGQRIFIVLTGLAVIVLLSQIAVKLNQSAPYAFQSVNRGVGTVVAIGDYRAGAGGEGGSGAITLEVAISDSVSMQADWRIPDPYWAALEPGATLAVIYQIDKLKTEIRILECGVVALKDDIQ
ncbi:MAG: hypothetical protein Q8N51_08280 [Gammaproteobacteria bacterium]|nr:hypothetical protein [Gammaproteobacteria bacterium]